MTSYYITCDSDHHAVHAASAEHFGAQYTYDGARAVLTLDDLPDAPSAQQIWLRSGAVPVVHRHDSDDHSTACAAWLDAEDADEDNDEIRASQEDAERKAASE